jgi:peptide/nickel transport system permease protein
MLGLVSSCCSSLVAILAPADRALRPHRHQLERIRKAPTAAHWFGTDEIGRDVLSRVIWGARASLLAGVVSVSIALRSACRSGCWRAMSAAGSTR